MMKKTLCFLLLPLATTSIATTQNGSPGNHSIGLVDVNFEVTQIAAISGVQNITISKIDPRDTALPTATISGVCLYSSTGNVSITSSVDNGIDRANQQATMVNGNYITHFRLELGGISLFGNATPNFSANINSQTCSDGAAQYPLTVTLTEVPQHAGVYQAVVHLQVDAV